MIHKEDQSKPNQNWYREGIDREVIENSIVYVQKTKQRYGDKINVDWKFREKKRLQQNQFDAFDFYKLLLPENSRLHILCKYQGTLTQNMILWSTQQNTEN